MFLGWSEGFHDAAVSIIDDKGKIVFASHSERFSGVKNEKKISIECKNFIESFYGNKIKHKAFFEKPLLKKSRQLYAGQLETVIAPREFTWTPDSNWHHHKSHAAGAFQTSNFDTAVAVVVDSIGEWDCTSIWKCHYNAQGRAVYKKVYNERYPESIGLWYSALTAYVGLRPLDEEYIFMGMAAFGKIEPKLCKQLDELLRYGSLHKGLPKDYFKDADNNDIAASAQYVLERKLHQVFAIASEHSSNIVYGGGVALNCVANTKLQKLYPDMWIMPNPGDAGGSLGAAALAYGKKVHWEHAYLGRSIAPSTYATFIADEVVEVLLKDGVCGIAHGRSEFGPRALGNRSLLADPRGKNAKDRVNGIKRRQKFRPFAPVVLEEKSNDYFANYGSSPHMSYVYRCYSQDVPAVVHKDRTSRIQTVPYNSPSIIRLILEKWYEATGCPLLLNTSLNIRGEPMVDTVLDAIRFEELYGVKVVY